MRRLIPAVLLLALIVFPAAAQPRSDASMPVLEGANYLPADATLYAAIRLDPGYLEQTTALLSRFEEIAGEADVREALIDSLGRQAAPLIDASSWIAVGTTAATANLDELTDRDSQAAFLFGIRDRAALEPVLSELEMTVTEQRGVWTLYSVDNAVYAALKDDLLIVSPDAGYVQMVLSGDYASLADAAAFTDVVGQLPEPAYDFIAYLDVGTVVRMSPEFSGRRGAEPPTAVTDAFGAVALAGVNRGGRDLLLDLQVGFGDLSALEAYGFSSAMITGPAVDPAFMAHLPANTQFVLHSRDIGGALQQVFDTLNAFGALSAQVPDVARSLRGVPGMGARFGDTAKAALNLVLTAALGLDVDADVINLLNGDFALFASIVPVRSPLRFAPALGLITADGAAGPRYAEAVSAALAEADLPADVTSYGDGGSIVSLSPMTDPIVAAEFSALAADDPAYDFALAYNDSVMILGSTSSAQYALAPDGPSLLDTPEFQHALESLLLDGAQLVGFINVTELRGIGEIPAEFTDLFESLSMSGVGAESGFSYRFSITLAQ